MEDEVIIKYSSNKNITFRGQLHTNMTHQEWIELGEKGQEQLLEEMVWELVELSPTVNGEPV